MRVLYDISVLGLGHVIPRARTGVFRVIESVAEELISNPECELTFCCENNAQSVRHAIQYLYAKNSVQAPFSIPSYFSDVKANQIRHELIYSLSQTPSLTLSHKILIKLRIRHLWLREKMLQKLPKETNYLFHPTTLRKTSIYHSPFYPIPQELNKSGKSVFLTCYDLIPLLYPQYCEQEIIQMIKRVVDSITEETWVLCISEATRNDLLNYLGNRVNPDRVIVTELAASSKFYKSGDVQKNNLVKNKYSIPIDSPYILSLCTLEPRKNIDQAIRAFVKIVKEQHISDLHLVLVGSKGWMFDKIFEEIEASADIKNRIIVTGFVPDEDLASVYSDALLFVYPSFYEGFGLPPLEAMQCGVPVITSNTSSLPEVVGNAGIMIDPRDLDSLCASMLEIYRSSSFRLEMARKSLERASQFSWKRCAEETVKAYKQSII